MNKNHKISRRDRRRAIRGKKTGRRYIDQVFLDCGICGDLTDIPDHICSACSPWKSLMKMSQVNKSNKEV